MFCKKCGTQNPDAAAFCKHCGTRLNEQVRPAAKTTTSKPVRPQMQPRVAHSAPKKKRNQNKQIGKIAVAAAVAIVLILSFVLFGGRSYKSTVKQFCNATFEADAKKIIKLLPNKMVDYALEESGYDEDELQDMIDELEEELQDQIDDLDRYLGENWEVSYEILGEEDIKGKELKERKETYKDIGVKVSASKDVEIEITIKSEFMDTSNTMTVSLIKVGRSWYLDMDSMGGLL